MCSRQPVVAPRAGEPGTSRVPPGAESVGEREKRRDPVPRCDREPRSETRSERWGHGVAHFERGSGPPLGFEGEAGGIRLCGRRGRRQDKGMSPECVTFRPPLRRALGLFAPLAGGNEVGGDGCSSHMRCGQAHANQARLSKLSGTTRFVRVQRVTLVRLDLIDVLPDVMSRRELTAVQSCRMFNSTSVEARAYKQLSGGKP